MRNSEFNSHVEPLDPESFRTDLQNAFQFAKSFRLDEQGLDLSGFQDTQHEETPERYRSEKSGLRETSVETKSRRFNRPNRMRFISIAAAILILIFGAYQLNEVMAENHQLKLQLDSMVPKIIVSTIENLENSKRLTQNAEGMIYELNTDFAPRLFGDRTYVNAVSALIQTSNAAGNIKDFHDSLNRVDELLAQVQRTKFGPYSTDIYVFAQMTKGYMLCEYGMDQIQSKQRPLYIARSLVSLISVLEIIDANTIQDAATSTKTDLSDLRTELIDLTSIDFKFFESGQSLKIFADPNLLAKLRLRTMALLAIAFHKFNIADPTFKFDKQYSIRDYFFGRLLGGAKAPLSQGGIYNTYGNSSKTNMFVTRVLNDFGLALKQDKKWTYEELDEFYSSLINGVDINETYARALTLTNYADMCLREGRANKEISLRTKAISLLEKKAVTQELSYTEHRVLRLNYYRNGLAQFRNNDFEKALAYISMGNAGKWKYNLDSTNSIRHQICEGIQISELERIQIETLTLFTPHLYPKGFIKATIERSLLRYTQETQGKNVKELFDKQLGQFAKTIKRMRASKPAVFDEVPLLLFEY